MKAGEIEIIEWQKAGLLKLSVLKPIFTTVEKKSDFAKIRRIREKRQIEFAKQSAKFDWMKDEIYEN